MQTFLDWTLTGLQHSPLFATNGDRTLQTVEIKSHEDQSQGLFYSALFFGWHHLATPQLTNCSVNVGARWLAGLFNTATRPDQSKETLLVGLISRHRMLQRISSLNQAYVSHLTKVKIPALAPASLSVVDTSLLGITQVDPPWPLAETECCCWSHPRVYFIFTGPLNLRHDRKQNNEVIWMCISFSHTGTSVKVCDPCVWVIRGHSSVLCQLYHFTVINTWKVCGLCVVVTNHHRRTSSKMTSDVAAAFLSHMHFYCTSHQQPTSDGQTMSRGPSPPTQAKIQSKQY